MATWNDATISKPEQYEIVIVAEGTGSTWYGYYNPETGKWYDDNFSSDMKVTHWMAFPEAPVTGEQNEKEI